MRFSGTLVIITALAVTVLFVANMIGFGLSGLWPASEVFRAMILAWIAKTVYEIVALPRRGLQGTEAGPVGSARARRRRSILSHTTREPAGAIQP